MTDHDPGAECCTGIYISDARIDVKLDGFSILHKDLLQKHSCDLACLHVGVGNEVPLWPI